MASKNLIRRFYVCDTSPEHGGPFYGVTLVALECGPGGVRKRKRKSFIVAHLCENCLREKIFTVKGSDLR